jgi:uncharacterized protein YkwD
MQKVIREMDQKTIVVGAMAFLLSLGSGLARNAPQAQPPAGKTEKEAALEQRLIELTNQERIRRGLGPLKLQTELRAAARWMARDMAEHDYIEHIDRLGRDIDTRIPTFGYSQYRVLGENLAAGQKAPETVVAGWLRSPSHRANLLNREFSEIGVGYATARRGKYRRFWAQDFGTRFDNFPIIINGEAAQTSDPNVRLYIYGAGWAKRMRLRNEGEPWTAWEPYRAERDWRLAPGTGRRTVLVELRNGEEIRRAEDHIELRPAREEA